jgi:hypothetical protein
VVMSLVSAAALSAQASDSLAAIVDLFAILQLSIRLSLYTTAITFAMSSCAVLARVCNSCSTGHALLASALLRSACSCALVLVLVCASHSPLASQLSLSYPDAHKRVP